MKYLFVGLGSIGQRHLQNLQNLKEDLEIYTLRKTNRNLVIKNGKAFKVKDLANYYNIQNISSLEEVKKIKPDVSFITNPSSLHVKTAIPLAKLGSHLFIEKPLSNNLKDVNILEKIIDEKNLFTLLGYQTRFHPIVKNVEKIIKKKKNDLISASFEWNTYLPFHHKYEDYSNGYAARTDLGGGATLNIIHEIDLIYHYFGMPQKIMAAGGKLSNLKMTADDTVMAILVYKIGKKLFPVQLNLSYAQTKEVRKFRIQFNDSVIFVDLNQNEFKYYDEKGELAEKYKEKIPRNDLFIKELNYFLNCVDKGEKSVPDVSEGRKSLEIALDIKKSLS
jgi:predicted dehydrogenase